MSPVLFDLATFGGTACAFAAAASLYERVARALFNPTNGRQDMTDPIRAELSAFVAVSDGTSADFWDAYLGVSEDSDHLAIITGDPSDAWSLMPTDAEVDGWSDDVDILDDDRAWFIEATYVDPYDASDEDSEILFDASTSAFVRVNV